MTPTAYQHIAPTIPGQPGIYKYFDSGDELLYVGKAKNLRKRVGSYFTKTYTSYKTHELVRRIARIEFTIVHTEQDAFLLENSLIKKFQPRFNINLKDDKTYPYIVIKNEPFPRVFLTRKKWNDGSEYLGPFTSVKKVRELMDFIKQTIPLRNCSLNLGEVQIKKGKYSVCLEYHLGNCKGPCVALQSLEEYNLQLVQLRNLLRGNLAPVIRHFRDEMKRQVSLLAFEKADVLKKKISFLEQYQARSVVASSKTVNMDVFSILKEEETGFVNFLMVRNGSIIQTQTLKLESKLGESIEEMLEFSIARMRSTFNSDVPEIVTPFRIDYPQAGTCITVPKGGDRKKLLELSEKNVRHFIEELKNKKRLHLGEEGTERMEILSQIQRDLHLPEIPVHIECFDNSNFQGSFPVSAMVCYRNGQPYKKEYRHFHVKTVTGINDFATMKEAVYRRYKRQKETEQGFPQLIIIDGGKGQLKAAKEALDELSVSNRTTLIGLAKNEEELFFIGDKESLKLPFNNPGLKMIRQIRNEVHRFGITFHRKKRSRGTFKNELEDIPGIGSSTAEALLKAFRSVQAIKEMIVRGNAETELGEVIGPSKSKRVIHYFQQQTGTK